MTYKEINQFFKKEKTSKVLRFIQNLQINIHKKYGKNKETLLYLACKYGHLEVVKYLIEHGAEVNIKNEWNETPLHRACEYGYLEIVKYLIEQGADVNAKSKNGNTPLHWACIYGYLDIAKLLIQFEADINVQNFHNETPLHWAGLYEDIGMLKYLIENNADFKLKNYKNKTPFDLIKNTNIKKEIKEYYYQYLLEKSNKATPLESFFDALNTNL